MAQIGSFVPAKFASMHVVDKLFTRIGTSDSIETNSSSFMVEMQETAHIVNNATERLDIVVQHMFIPSAHVQRRVCLAGWLSVCVPVCLLLIFIPVATESAAALY